MKKLTALSLSAALMLGSAMTASAQTSSPELMNDPLIKRSDDGIQITSNAVSGDELLAAELINVDRPVGVVDDIIMDEYGKIQFIRYETSRFRDYDEQGYVAVGDLEIEPAVGFQVEIDLADAQQELEPGTSFTIDDVQQRVLSEVLRNEVLVGNDSYGIRDVVFNRDGQAKYLLVGETGGGFLQDGEAYAIPFEDVTYEDGLFRTGITMDDMLPVTIFIG